MRFIYYTCKVNEIQGKYNRKEGLVSTRNDEAKRHPQPPKVLPLCPDPPAIKPWKKSSLSRTLIFVVWWRLRDLNSGHSGYEPLALANWAKPPYGADNQDWTGDLILTKDTLYRLSYISISNIGCGDRTWTCDLRVMSPTSYRLLHPAILYRSNVLLYSNTLPADKKLL